MAKKYGKSSMEIADENYYLKLRDQGFSPEEAFENMETKKSLKRTIKLLNWWS